MSRLRSLIRRLMGERRGLPRTGDGPGRRAADREPMRGWIPSIVIALAIAFLDWGVKFAINASMPIGAFRQVVEGRVALWHVRNPAMVLGLWENIPLASRQVLAVTAAFVGALALLQIVARGHRLTGGGRRWVWWFVGLVCGGMLGNLGERAIHWGVTDYLSFRFGEWWLPPGNIADAALFLSIPFALPVFWLELRARGRRAPQPPASERERGLAPSA